MTSRRFDPLLVAAAGTHATALALWPSAPLIALGLWWNSNTVSHNFIHRPFFRGGPANRAFSAGLSLLLGFPQTIWKQRHLAHHADRRAQVCFTRQCLIECGVVAGGLLTLALVAPAFLLWTYLPGWLAGMTLCSLQGRYEHRAGAPVDHRGALYNLLFFNDGYHTAHHDHPALGWRELPRVAGRARQSRWPAVLRWLDSMIREVNKKSDTMIQKPVVCESVQANEVTA